MNANETLHGLNPGDTIKLNTHNQVFTVTDVMFDGEMVDIEGPRGGEKALVENVNTGAIAVLNGKTKEGTVTEINV